MVATSRQSRPNTLSPHSATDRRLDLGLRTRPSGSRPKSPGPVLEKILVYSVPEDEVVNADLPENRQRLQEEQSSTPPQSISNGIPSPAESSPNFLTKSGAKLTRQSTEPTQLECINFTSVA